MFTHRYYQLTAAVLALNLIGSPAASATTESEPTIKECVTYTVGLPSLREARYGMSRQREAENSIASEEYQRNVSPLVKEKVLDNKRWLAIYSEVIVNYLEGNTEGFGSSLIMLENTSGLEEPIDDFNQNIARSRAFTLLRIYGETDASFEGKEHFVKKVIQIASSQEEKINDRERRALALAQARLGYETGNGSMIQESIQTMNEAEPPLQVDRHPEGFSDQVDAANSIYMARSQLYKATLSGQKEDFENAKSLLEPITNYSVDRCNALLVGQASYYSAVSAFEMAVLSKKADQKHENLVEALESVEVARRLLEKLHYPTHWRKAHKLSADIFEQLELNAVDEASRESYRTLKQRSWQLSKNS